MSLTFFYYSSSYRVVQGKGTCTALVRGSPITSGRNAACFRVLEVESLCLGNASRFLAAWLEDGRTHHQWASRMEGTRAYALHQAQIQRDLETHCRIYGAMCWRLSSLRWAPCCIRGQGAFLSLHHFWINCRNKLIIIVVHRKYIHSKLKCGFPGKDGTMWWWLEQAIQYVDCIEVSRSTQP